MHFLLKGKVLGCDGGCDTSWAGDGVRAGERAVTLSVRPTLLNTDGNCARVTALGRILSLTAVCVKSIGIPALLGRWRNTVILIFW